MPFWNGEKLLERLPDLIDGFRKEDVDCAAYTLSIGPEVYVSPSEQAAPKDQKIVQLAERESFVIPPGQFAFLLAEQTVTMPTNAIGFISMKASIKFRGLINVSGFHVDPGYVGRLVFAVFNAGPVPVLLRRGDPCFLIWYADLTGDSEMVKSGPAVTGLTSAHVNGISGAELHSIESLAKKIKNVEKAHDDKIHSLERDGALYKVAAGIVIAVGLANLKDCWSKHDPAVVAPTTSSSSSSAAPPAPTPGISSSAPVVDSNPPPASPSVAPLRPPLTSDPAKRP